MSGSSVGRTRRAFSQQDIELGLETATWTIAGFGLDQRAIAQTNYDPDQVSRRVIAAGRSNDSYWGTEPHYHLAEVAIAVTYRALIEQLQSNEPVVLPAVQALRHSIDDYAARIDELKRDVTSGLDRLAAVTGAARDVTGLATPISA